MDSHRPRLALVFSSSFHAGEGQYIVCVCAVYRAEYMLHAGVYGKEGRPSKAPARTYPPSFLSYIFLLFFFIIFMRLNKSIRSAYIVYIANV
jgi:hypothetical protein